MEAKLVADLPRGSGWQYEPKWDGFRCLAFKRGAKIELRSKSGQPLERYFPEVVGQLCAVSASAFVLDGELVVPVGHILSFDQLLQRIHPASSRVRMLSEKFPALFVIFDLLEDARGGPLVQLPLRERRHELEAFMNEYVPEGARLRLSPCTLSLDVACRWLRSRGVGLDGIIAKRFDLPYQSSNRHGMQKYKPERSADCVVGGFRYAARGHEVGSLLLGLYDRSGLLHHVGFASNIKASERSELTHKLERLVRPTGFTGRTPGGPSRWSNERSGEWQPLAPKLVAEVRYDHFSGERFRHGTRFMRWRPDKAPKDCRIEQVEQESAHLSTKLLSLADHAAPQEVAKPRARRSRS